MLINDLNNDVTQRFLAYCLRSSDSFEKGCEMTLSISLVCRRWLGIINTRLEPVQSLYERFFVRPLVPTPEQVLSDFQENAEKMHFVFRLSIGFYLHLPQEKRLYQGDKLVPLINQNIYEIGYTKKLCKEEFPGFSNHEVELNFTQLTRTNLAQTLIKKGDLYCLQAVLRSGVPLKREIKAKAVDGIGDEKIDLALDLFFLTLKNVSNLDLQNSKERLHAKEMLAQVMQCEDFATRQTENFFEKFEKFFDDHPSTYCAMTLWKLIEEIDDQNPMLNREKFLYFFCRCVQLETYTAAQIEELGCFVEWLMKDLTIGSTGYLPESPNHFFFPIVLKKIKERWYEYQFFLDACLDGKTDTHVANAWHIFQSILEDHRHNQKTIENYSVKDPFRRVIGRNYLETIMRSSTKIGKLFDDLSLPESVEDAESESESVETSQWDEVEEHSWDEVEEHSYEEDAEMLDIDSDLDEKDESSFSNVSFTNGVLSYESEDEIIKPPRKKARKE